MTRPASATSTGAVGARTTALGIVLLLLYGCGGEDEASPVEVDATWAGYCVATFTEPYAVVDVFGDSEFTAAVGDQFLLSEYGDAFGEDRASLIQDLPAGPHEFSISAPSGTRDFPFSTDCPFAGGQRHYAVFTDVSVFAEAELTTPLCQLSRGTAAVIEAGQGTGYAIASTEITFSGPATYEVFLGPLGAQCGGAATGFVSVPHTQVYGTGTWLVPFGVLLSSTSAQ